MEYTAMVTERFRVRWLGIYCTLDVFLGNSREDVHTSI